MAKVVKQVVVETMEGVGKEVAMMEVDHTVVEVMVEEV